MNVNNLDLNLIKVLAVLLDERHVTRAAMRLNLTQSATSSALKRLRVAFKDELLVQVGRRMQLTPRAEALKPKVEALMTRIEETIGEEKFDPGISERTFSLVSADYTTLTLVPALLDIIEREAPNMRLQIFEIADRTLPDLLEGRIDAVIAPRSRLFNGGLRSRTLLVERLVCIAAKRHPIVKGRIDLATFRALPHVRYQPGRNAAVSAEAMQMKKLKADTTPVLTCPSFAALPFLVGASSSVALVQERLARLFEKTAGLQILPPPVRTSPLEIALFWTPNRDGEAAHIWFRNAVARAMSPTYLASQRRKT